MKTSNKLVVAAMAGLMATASLGTIAHAAGTETATTAPEKAPVADAAKAATDAKVAYATQKELLRTADAALATLTHVRSARMALFDNKIDVAKTQVAEATKALAEGEVDLQALRVADTQKADAKPEYLPFDMSMMLTDTFKPTEENTAALKKAEGLMQHGEKDKAIEVLRVASVDIDISAALLPDAASMESLKKATDLIASKNYYDANLALKSIEDSVIVRSFNIDAIPVQGAGK